MNARSVLSALLAAVFLVSLAGCPQDPVNEAVDGNDDSGNTSDTVGGDSGNDVGVVDTGVDDVVETDRGVTDNGNPEDTTGTPDVDDDAGEAWACVPSGIDECENPGFDDDCDGLVDEVCGCVPQGSEQECYFGDPSHLSAPNTACQAGTQVCGSEFWLACEGAVAPGVEICGDGIDNDCDGEIDDIVDCPVGGPPQAICPDNFEGPVLSAYDIRGEYFDENGEPMTRAVWGVVGPPGHSYDLTYDPDGLGLSFFADVTGDYRFTLTVFNQYGEDSCETVFTATTADALRIELFWNPDYEDGDDGIDCSDLDLYLLRDPPAVGGSYSYYRPAPAEPNPNVCNWRNCATCTVPYTVGDGPRERQCREFLTNAAVDCGVDEICPDPVLDWSGAGLEDDPRLDLDDVEGHGPENINIRRPRAGDYRVGVHFFTPDNAAERNCANFTESEAYVRVICAGRTVFESEGVPLVGSTRSSVDGQFWEVGDLTVTYTSTGQAQCSFEELGVEDCRHVCIMSDADNGCSTTEIRNVMGTCIDDE